jgi:hypothetical protein
MYTPCYVTSDENGIESATGKHERVSNDRVSDWSVYKVTRFSKIHIRYNVGISGKLYPATFLSWRCHASHLLL